MLLSSHDWRRLRWLATLQRSTRRFSMLPVRWSSMPSPSLWMSLIIPTSVRQLAARGFSTTRASSAPNSPRPAPILGSR
jgi:hypothetical protein